MSDVPCSTTSPSPASSPIYLEALETEGKSPRTLTAYRESLSIYMETAKKEGLPLRADQISQPDVYRFIAAIRRRGVCDATQHRRHRELKSFFSWLRRLELVKENPFQKVPLIRLEQKIVRPFSSEEVTRMLAAYDETTLLGARNRAIILFLLDTGLRASELTNLNVADVDFEGGRARILHGKGKKQRVIAFSPAVTDAVLHYLETRDDWSGPLFQTRQGRRMRPQGLIVLFQRLSATTGIPHIHAHRFRHSFATMAIRSAAREIDVQHLLGHSTRQWSDAIPAPTTPSRRPSPTRRSAPLPPCTSRRSLTHPARATNRLTSRRRRVSHQGQHPKRGPH